MYAAASASALTHLDPGLLHDVPEQPRRSHGFGWESGLEFDWDQHFRKVEEDFFWFLLFTVRNETDALVEARNCSGHSLSSESAAVREPKLFWLGRVAGGGLRGDNLSNRLADYCRVDASFFHLDPFRALLGEFNGLLNIFLFRFCVLLLFFKLLPVLNRLVKFLVLQLHRSLLGRCHAPHLKIENRQRTLVRPFVYRRRTELDGPLVPSELPGDLSAAAVEASLVALRRAKRGAF